MVGQYKIRGGNVTAMKNDGSSGVAQDVALWVNLNGGKAVLFPKGHFDYDLDNAYVQIESPRPQKVVGPGWWVVMTEDGFFFAMNSMDFDIIYEQVMPEGETAPEFDWGREKE